MAAKRVSNELVSDKVRFQAQGNFLLSGIFAPAKLARHLCLGVVYVDARSDSVLQLGFSSLT